MSFFRRVPILLAATLMTACTVAAQQPTHLEQLLDAGRSQPETTVAEALQSLSERAGVIFLGRVQSIEHEGGAVVVEFAVEQAVQGVDAPVYRLREWGGLWTAGQQRYRVGERALVFLHAASAAGFSSPVDGMQGVVPVIPMGADREPLLDVRWLQTRLLRSLGAPLADADSGAVSLTGALQVLGHADRPQPQPVALPLPAGLRPVAPLPGGVYAQR